MTTHQCVVRELGCQQTDELVERFERFFSRPPSSVDLLRLRRGEAALHLRLPARTKRRVAALIASV